MSNDDFDSKEQPDDVDGEWSRLLFDWITQLEGLAYAIPPGKDWDHVVDALLELRRGMVDRLYALGGEYADIHRKNVGR